MKTYGLIGYPLSHSFSQKYFTEKFKKENISDCKFLTFEIENLYVHDFRLLLKANPNLCGLSATIPHKQNIIKFLDEIDESAKEIGAVNCIKRWRMDDGKWMMKGYNTDVFGFESSLKSLLQEKYSQALILGTGGASKAVAFVLKKLGIEFLFISRNKNQISSIGYQDLNEKIITSYSLIINTTPLGMFPNVNDCPNIPYQFLSSKHLLYDLNYNPEESLFLKNGKEKGAQIKNGLEMLHLQADKAWEIWNS